jgi:hypothetical protein
MGLSLGVGENYLLIHQGMLGRAAKDLCLSKDLPLS